MDNGNIICKIAAMPAACLLPLAANTTASVVNVKKFPLPTNMVGRYNDELTEKPIAKDVRMGNVINGILIRNNLWILLKPKLAPNISYRISDLLHIGPNVRIIYGKTKR